MNEINDSKFNELEAEVDNLLKAQAGEEMPEAKAYTGGNAFSLVCKSYELLILQTVSDAKKEELTENLKKLKAIEKDGEKSKKLLYNFCADLIAASPSTALPQDCFCKAKITPATGPFKNVLVGFELSSYELDEQEMDEFIRQFEKKEDFADVVNRFMQEKNLTPPEVYRNADLSRQDFSRILSPKSKGVSRIAVYNLAIGLRLDREETKKLLRSAGYAYNRNSKFDLIIMYCIAKRYYDIFGINQLLKARTGKSLISSYQPNVSDKNVK